MNQANEAVPVKVDTPEAVARQQMDFGDASRYGELSGEYPHDEHAAVLYHVLATMGGA